MSAEEQYINSVANLSKEILMCQDIEVLRATGQDLIGKNRKLMVDYFALQDKFNELLDIAKKQGELIKDFKALDVGQGS